VAEPVEASFGEYSKDCFDFITIDEYHWGIANLLVTHVKAKTSLYP
jgi:hypothetical protein